MSTVTLLAFKIDIDRGFRLRDLDRRPNAMSRFLIITSSPIDRSSEIVFLIRILGLSSPHSVRPAFSLEVLGFRGSILNENQA